MKKLLLHKGEKFQSAGLGKFAKDILIQDVFLHPSTGQVVDLSDPKRLDRLAANSSRYHANGNKIPFPDGHSMDAMKNLGDWDGAFVVEKGRLYGAVNPRGTDVQERLASGKIDGVSAMIEFDVTDSKGNRYDEVITHICATDYPVVTGQKPFIPLSKFGAEEVPLFLSKHSTEGMSPEGQQKEASMLKKTALALGLSEDATEEQILAAVAKRDTEAKGLAEKVKAVEGLSVVKPEDLKAHGFEVKDGKVVKLAAAPPPADDPEKAAMRAENEALKLAAARANVVAARSKAEGYIKSGLVPPAQVEALSKLFTLHDGLEAQALSADGKTITKEKFDVVKTFDEILKAAHKLTGVKLSRLPVADDGEPKEKTAEELRKEGAALAREFQGTKTETA